MIVVDVGCKAHAGEISIPELVARFNPDVLFGFDPHPELGEGVSRLAGSLVVTRRAAAWTSHGTIAFTFDGTRSRIDNAGVHAVPCFDFAAWLALLPPGELVVKMDVEGSEYSLLERMRNAGADELVDLLLVEWHGGWIARREKLERSLRCPVEPW